MSDLIDRKALIDRINRMWESRQLTNTKHKTFIELLDAEPVIEAVPLDYHERALAEEVRRHHDAELRMVEAVRCRDCKHYHTEEDRVKPKACDLFNFDVDEEDFCSRGWEKNEQTTIQD